MLQKDLRGTIKTYSVVSTCLFPYQMNQLFIHTPCWAFLRQTEYYSMFLCVSDTWSITNLKLGVSHIALISYRIKQGKVDFCHLLIIMLKKVLKCLKIFMRITGIEYTARRITQNFLFSLYTYLWISYLTKLFFTFVLRSSGSFYLLSDFRTGLEIRQFNCKIPMTWHRRKSFYLYFFRSQNHGVVWVWRDVKDHLVPNLFPWAGTTCNRPGSNLALNTSKNGTPTTFLDNMLQCLTTLTIKNFPLICRVHSFS